MLTFKYSRNKQHRYNIYESRLQNVVIKSNYKLLRNFLLVISILISVLVISLIVFDNYQSTKTDYARVLLTNQIESNLVKDEITHYEITQAISNGILHKIETEESLENISNVQLKHLVKTVMEKIEYSPNKIIYTQK
ncbi:MAG: Unknown protein [uncultured Sulfurovum sp.]|uniref:Uncharacterized protein n=1 Tax=uncultured Sulfurovum sp. TaxID=269237 RepID=A0A6S6TYL5_9BACT|nr:MAG: Unknown protein [uncultured Sulfurovum sp.]